MTDARFEIPAGFTSADIAPNATWSDRYEVLYVPHGSQTHFESGVGKYDVQCRDKRYSWKTVDNDNVGDSGRAVFAWRPQQDEMRIVRLAPAPVVPVEPTNRKQYDEAVALLAVHHLELVEDGEADTRPGGVELTSRLFEVPVEQVERDYAAVAARRTGGRAFSHAARNIATDAIVDTTRRPGRRTA